MGKWGRWERYLEAVNVARGSLAGRLRAVGSLHAAEPADAGDHAKGSILLAEAVAVARANRAWVAVVAVSIRLTTGKLGV